MYTCSYCRLINEFFLEIHRVGTTDVKVLQYLDIPKDIIKEFYENRSSFPYEYALLIVVYAGTTEDLYAVLKHFFDVKSEIQIAHIS